MKYFQCACVALIVCLGVSQAQEQRVLRRVVKVGANGARVRLLGARAAPAPAEQVAASGERGAVAEISSKEAANFGQRSLNETAAAPIASSTTISSTTASSTTTSSTTTTAAPSTSSTTTAPTTTTTTSSTSKPTAARADKEVELLSSAPSSWQSMMAVEAPAAMLLAVENAPIKDLAPVASSERHLLENLPQPGDFLRGSAATKGGKLVQETHEYRENSKVTQQQQQQHTFFYPRKPAQVVSKTAPIKVGVKGGHWYQPAPTTTTTTTSTTPRPAPLVQEYEQEQYQQQVEYGPAPLGEAEPFAFDFKTLDNSGNGQYRKEESDKNGVVRGSYGYTDANGIYRHVEYIADQDGFRANIKSNEPGLIGETQPASIQYSAGGVPPAAAPAAAAASQRFSAPSRTDISDWIPETLPTASGANSYQDAPASGELAMASPDFESSHKPERITRLPRNYRN